MEHSDEPNYRPIFIKVLANLLYFSKGKLLISSKFACYYKVSGVDSRRHRKIELPLSVGFDHFIR